MSHIPRKGLLIPVNTSFLAVMSWFDFRQSRTAGSISIYGEHLVTADKAIFRIPQKRRLLFIFLCVALAFTQALHAGMVKGRIQTVSKQAGSIQIGVDDKKVVIRTDANTRFDGFSSIDELGPPDLIEAEFEPGQPATKIRKVVFALPPGVEIDTGTLLKIMTGKQPYHLYDARPVRRFGNAHIPGARPAHPKDENFLSLLPGDKDELLVFYCGGPTCPYTGLAVAQAQQAGYTSLRGYQAGLPGWIKSKLPVHSDAAWLAKNLNQQTVILDVRDTGASSASHIQGAVALPVADIQAMTRRFIEQKTLPELPGVTDMRAPVVVYADSHTSREALLAYKELRDWGYSGATVLFQGFSGWQQAGLPTAEGPAATEIVYRKKLAPGAIAPEEFVALEKSREGVYFIDVRSDKEAATGMLRDARHIPLEKLEDAASDLPGDSEIIIYCANGIRAEMAYETLNKLGIKARFLNETITIDKQGNYRL
jgi:rhodanese-related sulfurtransferase